MRWLGSLTLLIIFAACTPEMYQTRTDDINKQMRVLSDQRREYSDLRREFKTLGSKVARLERAMGGKRDNLQLQLQRVVSRMENTEKAFSAVRDSQGALQSRLSELDRYRQLLNERLDENKYETNRSLKKGYEERERLQGRIEDLSMNLQELEDKVTSLEEKVKGLQTNLKRVEKRSGEAGQAGRPGLAGGKTGDAVKKAPPRMTEQESYQAALESFRAGKYMEARRGFEAFLKIYPATSLSDNASFWIAESYYKDRDMENAILSYESLIKRFPKSDKVPGAMLKQAYAFLKLHDNNTAQMILSALKEKFPGSKEAELAVKKLAEIEKKE